MPLFRFLAVGIARTLSKVFGLATVMFFGRMPSRDDDRIAFVGIASLAWFALVAAVLAPGWAERIIPFAPDDADTTRGIAVGLAALLPLVIGASIARMHNHAGEGRAGVLRHTLAGYRYTASIGFTVAAVVVVVPIVRASHLIRRFGVHRLMVMIPEGGHARVRDDVVRCLEDHGVEVSVARPNLVVGWLFGRLARVLGRIFGRAVADEMTVLRGRDRDGAWFEVDLHAADITIIGHERVSPWIYATLADGVDERLLYFTWDDDSQAVEDRLHDYRDQLAEGQDVDPDAVGQLATELARLRLDQEEWNAVRRCIYRLERDAERRRAGRGKGRAHAS